MNREDIKKIIPHRDNMLLVDEAYISEDGEAKGFYLVRGDEFFLKGHFPGNPVVPGVILCEIMAQTCAVLLSEENTEDEKMKTPYFTGLDKVKFRSPVKPNDKLELVCSIVKKKPPFYFAKGKGYVDGKLCVSGEFSFALVE